MLFVHTISRKDFGINSKAKTNGTIYFHLELIPRSFLGLVCAKYIS